MRRTRLAAVSAALLLCACALQPPRRAGPEEVAPPAAAMARDYEQIARTRQPVFEIDPARSLLVLEVRRSGSLAHLGHDHVVASHGVHGYVAPQQGRADLYVRLDELAVDEPELRSAAGFDTTPSAADIAATRENMLGKVLHVDEHPFAVVSLSRIGSDDKSATLRASVTLNGVTRSATIEARIEGAAEAMRVTGQTTLVQSDFGIAPFSILGGAIQVQDSVSVRFDIRTRLPEP